MTSIVFKPSRKKWIPRLILAAMGLLVGGYLAFVLPRSIPNFPNWILITVGIVLMGYSSIMLLMARAALSKRNKGLVFDHQGIKDSSSIIGYGEISWKEIVEICIEKKEKHPRILVLVKRPKTYIDQASNNAIKRLRQVNFDNFGSPVIFETDQFDIDLKAFETFMVERRTTLTYKTFV